MKVVNYLLFGQLILLHMLHKGILTASRDLVQKQMLEWNECVVVDLWWEECPELWEENVNEKSLLKRFLFILENQIYYKLCSAH